ncbi:ABC transporter permease [Micrococcales bacterium 31B]|nr:ABC transporter permease [Micrococcales bacterium 31B]
MTVPADQTLGAKVAPRRPKLAVPQDVILLVPLAAVLLAGFIYSPIFLTVSNQVNVLQAVTEFAPMVLAQTLILISGRMDLSLESTFGLAPAFAVWLIVPAAAGGLAVLPNTAGMGYLAIVIALVVGVLIGLINAGLILGLKLNGFIVTLGMLIALRGLQKALTGGSSLSGLPESFMAVGSATVGVVPISVIIMVVIFAVGIFVLTKTPAGRTLYAIGGNVNAARAAGINTTKVLLVIFVLGGFLAALAGIMQAGRLGGIQVTQGSGYIFTVFAACVIAGVSLNGGKGSLLSAFLGILLLFEVRNVLTILGVSDSWTDALNGAIILAALAIARFASGKAQD